MPAHLPRSFYARDTLVVSRELLGMHLVRLLSDGTRLSGLIVETEAYRPGDRASHSYYGRTQRNMAMFMQPGTAYVYQIHGVHNCLNFSTEDVDIGSAVLIRALQPVQGIDVMQQNRRSRTLRGKEIPLYDLCRGPARLCYAMDIDLQLNAYDTLQIGSLLFVESGPGCSDAQVGTSPRIGVFGDERALSIEWRWYVKGSPYVSGLNRTNRVTRPEGGDHEHKHTDDDGGTDEHRSRGTL